MRSSCRHLTFVMDAKPEDVGLSSQRLARVNHWAGRLINDGRLLDHHAVLRRGKLVHFNACGMADIKREKKISPDTIFRFYSMTKPLTSTAIMILYEEGHFQLDDPITRFLACFRNMRVFTGAARGNMETIPTETVPCVFQKHARVHRRGEGQYGNHSDRT